MVCLAEVSGIVAQFNHHCYSIPVLSDFKSHSIRFYAIPCYWMLVFEASNFKSGSGPGLGNLPSIS